MLTQAMDSFIVASREHKENVKAQYIDKKGLSGAKNYFRASELGSKDRKILYSFFAHNLPRKSKTPKNLRQLANGDGVHERYQTAWEEMGVLISMEERLSSWNDEYLGAKDEKGDRIFPWEWAGHYDGLLDLNILRAHALGLAKVESVFNEETSKYDIQVEIDEAYANSIGLFEADGSLAPDYAPPTLLADIKTMNPWGFKRIKEQGDVSEIGGYIDQISFYMYMMNTPYGSIFIEAKDSNDVVEVQIIWKDMHEGVEYTFDENIHGAQTDEQLRITIDSGRFFGDATREGCVPRLNRLWQVKQELQKADEAGDRDKVIKIFLQHVPRCSDKPDKFPCSWGHKTGKIDGCEFFEHCWSDTHKGMAVRPVEDCPPEALWEFEDENDQPVRIDSRKVPEGVSYEGFIALVEKDAIDYTKFLVDSVEPSDMMAEVDLQKAADSSMHGTKMLFTETGELNLGTPEQATETEEYEVDDSKAIKCVNCHKEVTYKKLAPGMKKKCTFCKHTNQVVRL
jgi:hypothetical protein